MIASQYQVIVHSLSSERDLYQLLQDQCTSAPAISCPRDVNILLATKKQFLRQRCLLNSLLILAELKNTNVVDSTNISTNIETAVLSTIPSRSQGLPGGQIEGGVGGLWYTLPVHRVRPWSGQCAASGRGGAQPVRALCRQRGSDPTKIQPDPTQPLSSTDPDRPGAGGRPACSSW